MKYAVIFDIDGTLADSRHRIHYLNPPNGVKKNWTKFFTESSEDEVFPLVRKCVEIVYSTGIEPLMVTARPDSERERTVAWLTRHSVPFTGLYMRGSTDRRVDHLVKQDLLAKIQLDGYVPLAALDDKTNVLDMWLSNGLRAYKCTDGVLEPYDRPIDPTPGDFGLGGD